MAQRGPQMDWFTWKYNQVRPLDLCGLMPGKNVIGWETLAPPCRKLVWVYFPMFLATRELKTGYIYNLLLNFFMFNIYIFGLFCLSTTTSISGPYETWNFAFFPEFGMFKTSILLQKMNDFFLSSTWNFKCSKLD